MAFSKFTEDMEIIGKLDDKPNDMTGHDAAWLKAQFDEAGKALKAFLNETLIAELEASGAKNIGIDNDGTQLTSTTIQGALEELDTVARQSAEGVVSVGSITTEKLHALAVTTQKIAELAVTEAKIAAGAVTEEKLATGSVAEGKIANGAVTGQKIAAAAVTTEKMGQGAVTGEKTNFSAGLPVTGPLVLTSGVGYGDSLPSSGVEGQLFFLKV